MEQLNGEINLEFLNVSMKFLFDIRGNTLAKLFDIDIFQRQSPTWIYKFFKHCHISDI